LFAHLAGFSPGQVLSDILGALILAVLAFARRYYKRELIDPVRELRDDVRDEKRKRKRFQKSIVKRIDDYETKAQKERELQVEERTRVAQHNVPLKETT
jgi:UPF0716 family protein affecting phage T7 exclusion